MAIDDDVQKGVTSIGNGAMIAVRQVRFQRGMILEGTRLWNLCNSGIDCHGH